MNSFILFFQQLGELPEPIDYAIFFAVLGLIGGILGYLRWWLGVIWIVLPCLMALFFVDEINQISSNFKDNWNYIWKSYLAMSFGIALNIVGIYLGFNRRKKLKLK
jgi:hypothetical protein